MTSPNENEDDTATDKENPFIVYILWTAMLGVFIYALYQTFLTD